MQKWLQGWVTEEEFYNIAWGCMNGLRKTKAQLHSRLAKGLKGNKKSYYCHFNSDKLNKKNMWLLLHERGVGGDLVAMDTAKAEITEQAEILHFHLCYIFIPFFNTSLYILNTGR